MGVRYLVFHNLFDIFAAVFEYQVCAAGVVVEEGCDVVDFGTDCHVAGLGGVVSGDLGRRQGR